MPPERILRTIMFVDIAKSTHLYNCLGDIKAKRIILGALQQLGQIAQQFNGQIIKTIGDELMISFQRSSEAIEAAIEMQYTLTETAIPDLRQDTNLNIYIGIESGYVLCDDSDLFGETVNIAARMVNLAKPRQILTTGATVDSLSSKHQHIVKLTDRTNIKGIDGEIPVYEVIWEEQEITMEVPSRLMNHAMDNQLILTYQDNTLQIGMNRSVITLGRQEHNDMVICNHNVSRTHARIEYRHGRFFLIDQSKNGTYVIYKDQEQLYLKNNETLLKETGDISLGQSTEEKDATLIGFRIIT